MATPTGRLSYAQGLETLLHTLKQPQARLLLYGAPGSGKSHLAAELARRLQVAGLPCFCLSADPGAPAFGLPAALNLGCWCDDNWQLLEFEPFCSLNAARFRLPLIEVVGRLAEQVSEHPLIIDAPGVSRGIAAAELLPALVNTCRASSLAVLEQDDELQPLHNELRSLTLPVLPIQAHTEASRPSRSSRARSRTGRWLNYLTEGRETTLTLDDIPLLGTPPPQACPEKWQGLLTGLRLAGGRWLMGEVIALHEQNGGQLNLRCPANTDVEDLQKIEQLLVRDARHLPDQPLTTAESQQPPVSVRQPAASLAHPAALKPLSGNPRVCRGDITAELINGLFEDPLLLIKPHWSRRCLLFDLGHTSRLPLRFAHSVSDVFISHAHIDHIGGFMGLLRTRLGAPAPCSLYGPPGLARHIAGMLSGILWDRIGDSGPVFQVAELHGGSLKRYRLQTGDERIQPLPDLAVTDGVILTDERFQIRAVELDHGTPVLAFAYEPCSAVTVDTEALEWLGLAAGPWLAELKDAYLAGERHRTIQRPNGRCEPAGALADRLLHRKPGEKLVYATDLADSADNRAKLVALARGAQTLICEAAFSQADRQRALDHGHLTTTACGEIAAEAGVQQLMPFHFSRRYEQQTEMMYREIEAIFSKIVR
ncbi:Clp1/GlmU family protein [Marinobacterium arenosum]|uniref:Clp1/GlmU family protein n=1 Tax=Marinobacterium arenosum TaxID=2862496 RepID=UPI001C93FEA3|nr:Clp1/GlmU family protein [Marinobacterium arenosum]MBY4675219.1 MBL fold metallo-hydrolase [Marinobacterium arenosum]